MSNKFLFNKILCFTIRVLPSWKVCFRDVTMMSTRQCAGRESLPVPKKEERRAGADYPGSILGAFAATNLAEKELRQTEGMRPLVRTGPIITLQGEAQLQTETMLHAFGRRRETRLEVEPDLIFVDTAPLEIGGREHHVLLLTAECLGMEPGAALEGSERKIRILAEKTTPHGFTLSRTGGRVFMELICRLLLEKSDICHSVQSLGADWLMLGESTERFGGAAAPCIAVRDGRARVFMTKKLPTSGKGLLIFSVTPHV